MISEGEGQWIMKLRIQRLEFGDFACWYVLKCSWSNLVIEVQDIDSMEGISTSSNGDDITEQNPLLNQLGDLLPSALSKDGQKMIKNRSLAVRCSQDHLGDNFEICSSNQTWDLNTRSEESGSFDQQEKGYIFSQKKVGFSGTHIQQNAFTEHDSIMHSLKVPSKLELSTHTTCSEEELLRIKRISLATIRRQRNEVSKFSPVEYEKKLKINVKLVTNALYLRILYSHTNMPKPSKSALLFNYKNFLPCQKVICSTNDFSMMTSFPTFLFSVTTDELLELKDEWYCKVDPTSHCYKQFGSSFSLAGVPKQIVRKYQYLKTHISDMIFKIFRDLQLEPESAIIALVYLERLIISAKLELRASNWRPLLFTSIVLATKYWEDCNYWNVDFYEYQHSTCKSSKNTLSDWDTSPEFCDFPLKSINAMESKFLSLMQFDLYVSPATYQKYTIQKSDSRMRKMQEYRKYGFIRTKKNLKSNLIPI